MRDPEQIRKVIIRFSEQRLNRFADRYISLARDSKVITHQQGMTNIYPDSSTTELPLELIKQFSIYAHTIFIHDPLLKWAESWLSSNIANRYVADKKDRGIMYLENILSYILKLKPLVDSEIVVLIPYSITESPKDNPIYLTDFYSPEGRVDKVLDKSNDESSIPEAIDNYATEQLKIYLAKYNDGRLVPDTNYPISFAEGQLKTRDKISFQFQDDPVYWPYHMVSQMQFGDEGHISGLYSFKDVEIEPDIFQHWVLDKRSEVINLRVNALLQDIFFATQLKAKLITNSKVSKDLAFSRTDDTSISANVIRNLINLQLPYFDQATFTSIAQARKNEGSFLEFISALEKAFTQIDALSNDENYSIEVDIILRDLLTRPIAEVEQSLKKLEKSIFRDSGLLALGTLICSTAALSGNLFAEAVVIVLTGIIPELSNLGKYRTRHDELSHMPSFFYWDATRKK